MTITAKFSNGHTDTYKGKRNVKAAWMITDKATGDVLLSGHSLDRNRAQATAENNCHVARGTFTPGYMVNRGRAISPAYVQWIVKKAREDGLPCGTFNQARDAMREANSRRRAEQRAAVNIEVIDL